jgi:hypothetical protein
MSGVRRASLLVLLVLSAFAPAVARDDASRAMAGRLLPAASFGETRPLEQDGRAWSQWRGPGGMGVSIESGLPTESAPDKNILWKTAVNTVGESVYASPAIANGRIYIRGDRHLFAIGEK